MIGPSGFRGSWDAVEEAATTTTPLTNPLHSSPASPPMERQQFCPLALGPDADLACDLNGKFATLSQQTHVPPVITGSGLEKHLYSFGGGGFMSSSNHFAMYPHHIPLLFMSGHSQDRKGKGSLNQKSTSRVCQRSLYLLLDCGFYFSVLLHLYVLKYYLLLMLSWILCFCIFAIFLLLLCMRP